MTPTATTEFRRTLLRWFDRHGRHDLPWQHPRDAYRVWISEIMLQQTQVSTVIPYFKKFIKHFPNVRALARADINEVLHHWSGLGYYARARNLHRAAQNIVSQHQGKFPNDFDQIIELPGIGRSTAGAILAQAFAQRHAILDGNVKRVLTRMHAVSGWPGDKMIETQLWNIAEQLTPTRRVVDYTQAIMDLGATVCTRSKPRCTACPLRKQCKAFAQGTPTAFPTARARKSVPVRNAQFLILVDAQDQILLQHRPPSGIWGGLWSLPECPPEQDPAQWCKQHLRLRPQAFERLPMLQHKFSHFQLNIQPLRSRVIPLADFVQDKSEYVWYPPQASLKLGLPKPVQTLITQWSEAPTKTAVHRRRKVS